MSEKEQNVLFCFLYSVKRVGLSQNVVSNFIFQCLSGYRNDTVCFGANCGSFEEVTLFALLLKA